MPSERKRSFAEFASSSDPDLTVVTADGGRIPAHCDVLRLVCSCLKNCPASDTWDLSTMLLNGNPVKEETVAAVLQFIYSSMHALEYEMDTTAGQYSLSQLQEMLLFADAVGCSKRLLISIAGFLDTCVAAQLQITLPNSSSASSQGGGGSSSRREGGRAGRSSGRGRGGGAATATAAAAAAAAADAVTFTLDLDEAYVFLKKKNRINILRWCRNAMSDKVHQEVESEEEAKQVSRQVFEQLEPLLYVAFKLDLQQLVDRALRFTRANSLSPHSILRVKPDGNDAKAAATSAADLSQPIMFSPRVLAAAAGSSSGSVLLSCACLQEPLGRGFGIGGLFKDAEGASDIKFKATLSRDFFEFAAGTRVKVCFGGTNGCMTVTSVAGPEASMNYAFGVLIGPTVTFDSLNAGSGGSETDGEDSGSSSSSSGDDEEGESSEEEEEAD